MPIKISANQSAVAHHVIDGPFTFPYAIDAHSAVSRFPKEWSHTPWSLEAEAKARQAAGAPEVEMTDEERAAIEAHAEAVAAAKERLEDYYNYKRREKEALDKVAADEELVKQPAPRPAVKPLTPAQIRRQAAETDEERATRERGEKAAADKANEDRLASNPNTIMT